jgi:hypothetical protein
MSADFPKNSLEQALSVPNALMLNSGQPMSVIDLATALGKSPGSSGVRLLGKSSGDYGLTSGSYKTQFRMEPTGRAVVEPRSPEERTSALVKAALTPTAFSKVYEFYKGKKVPEQQYLSSTVVRDFDVDARQVEAFTSIFLANLRFVGLVKATPGGDWITASADASNATLAAPETQPDEEAEPEFMADEVHELDVPVPPADPGKKKRPNKLFIGHGKNKTPLDQLTKTLTELQIPFVVVQDLANEGRPISQKVRDAMEQCSAAVLIFSADEEYFDKDANSVWKPSENVAHELGAASVMYDNRVILFKEEAVQLASNYSGIGYIPFEKNKLDAKTNELLRELLALRILRFAPVDEDA